MRVYQVLRSTLLWTLQARSRHHHGHVVPVSNIPISRLTQSVVNFKRSRVGPLAHLRPPTSHAFRRQPAGRMLLELRAGASMPSLLTKFTRSIGASKTKSWILLILCICNETAAVTITKKAYETSNKRLFASAVGLYILTLCGFALTLGQIDVSIAYAVWSALGTAIVAVAGVVLFHETFSLQKLLCLALIIVGVAGLNLLDEH